MNIRYKYPRTYHVPWSENLKNDDRMHHNMEGAFHTKAVIVTEKLDGENTTMYNDIIHARSIDSQNSNHPSRDMVKGLWGNIKHVIHPDCRICGENMYAEHSIKYEDLESYFYVFSMWFEQYAYSWDKTLQEIAMIKHNTGIELSTVPILYYGIYDEDKIHNTWLKYTKDLNRESEGYVIRIHNEISFDFESHSFFFQMAKYVRKNHVQTDEHWLRTWDKTKINKLKVQK